MKIAAIIPAGGAGIRMGQKIPKPYLSFASAPIVVHTLRVFQESDLIDDIFLVVQEKDKAYVEEDVIHPYSLNKVRAIIPGGKERQDSTHNALPFLQSDHEIVVIHDGVRPLIEQALLERTIDAAIKDGAAIPGVPVKDTVKRVLPSGEVDMTIDRENLYLIQTPQAFRKEILAKAYEMAYKEQFYGTDDASLVERLGIPVKVIRGSYENIKITTPDDLLLAEYFVQNRRKQGIK